MMQVMLGQKETCVIVIQNQLVSETFVMIKQLAPDKKHSQKQK